METTLDKYSVLLLEAAKELLITSASQDVNSSAAKETTVSTYPWPLLREAAFLIVISALDGPTGLEAQSAAYDLILALAKEGYHEEQQLSDLLRYTLDQTEDRLDGTPYAKLEGFLDHVNSTVRTACVRLKYKLNPANKS